MLSLIGFFAAVLAALAIGERVYRVRQARKRLRVLSLRSLEMHVTVGDQERQ